MAKEETTSEATIKQKAARAEENLAQMKSASSTALWVGRLVLVIVAVVAVWQVLGVLQLFNQFKTNQEQYLEAARAEMDSLVPILREEAGDMAEELLPAYKDAFTAEFQKGAPEIMETFSSELDIFVNNVGGYVNESLENEFDRVLQKQMNILAEEAPELKDFEERQEIKTQVLDVCFNVSRKLATEFFKPQIDALKSLGTTLEEKPVPENIHQMNDRELLNYTFGKIKDLLMLKMVILQDVFAEPQI